MLREQHARCNAMDGATKSGYIAAGKVLRGTDIGASLAIEARRYGDLIRPPISVI